MFTNTAFECLQRDLRHLPSGKSVHIRCKKGNIQLRQAGFTLYSLNTRILTLGGLK